MAFEKRNVFETLYQEYYQMVFQVCLGFVKGDKPLAADLSQEVFINTWNALAKFQGKSSYKTWIYRITVNTCLQFIRKDTKHKAEAISDSTFEIATYQEDHQAEEQNTMLFKAIGKLEELDRLIIMMVLDELEYAEVSMVLGISEGNLRVKIHRIKAKLKTLMSHEKSI